VPANDNVVAVQMPNADGAEHSFSFSATGNDHQLLVVEGATRIPKVNSIVGCAPDTKSVQVFGTTILKIAADGTLSGSGFDVATESPPP
jgi:hypothetical protein